jgi:hypothetical protein
LPHLELGLALQVVGAFDEPSGSVDHAGLTHTADLHSGFLIVH